MQNEQDGIPGDDGPGQKTCRDNYPGRQPAILCPRLPLLGPPSGLVSEETFEYGGTSAQFPSCTTNNVGQALVGFGTRPTRDASSGESRSNSDSIMVVSLKSRRWVADGGGGLAHIGD